MMSSVGPVHFTGMTPARFQVVISSAAAVIAVIAIVWGMTLISWSCIHIASHWELESTGRLRRRLVYLIGPRRLCVNAFMPPSRYSNTSYSKPRPSILVQIPSGRKPSTVHR